jgi:hypothetical protein
MKFVLRFVAGYNISAGLFMVFASRAAYKLIGMPNPKIHFPIQLVGILVGLFGVGYYLVSRRPLENVNLLLLGFLSKLLGSCLATGYVLAGILPLHFVGVYFVSDVVYLPPFYIILARLRRMERSARAPGTG